VAFCRNVVDKCWYEFDDSTVTRVSELEVYFFDEIWH
jgi:hypothetical protein